MKNEFVMDYRFKNRYKIQNTDLSYHRYKDSMLNPHSDVHCNVIGMLTFDLLNMKQHQVVILFKIHVCVIVITWSREHFGLTKTIQTKKTPKCNCSYNGTQLFCCVNI